MSAAPIQPVPERDSGGFHGWAIDWYPSVVSTQELARSQPAWSAVCAAEQSAGRGQADRVFVSDAGGLYLTAVLPYDGDALAAKGFALAVGWALCEALTARGIVGLRLRWPNDIMADGAKVGGILIEQGGPTTLLVGVGLNVSNRPWRVDPALRGAATSLADLCGEGAVPDKTELAVLVLAAIRRAHEEFGRRRLAGMVSLLASVWGKPRAVVLEPARGVTLAAGRGNFLGIDSCGAVRLETGQGIEARIPAHHIQRLRETSGVLSREVG